MVRLDPIDARPPRRSRCGTRARGRDRRRRRLDHARRLRDELQTSRRYAQALLEALDADRVTLRLPDDRRILRRSARAERG